MHHPRTDKCVMLIIIRSSFCFKVKGGPEELNDNHIDFELRVADCED